MAASARPAEEPVEYQFQLPIKTERDLRLFVKMAWGVEFPDKQVCEGHTTPWRAFVDAYFARHPVTVWKGSRALAGKTFDLACLSLTEGVTLGADVNLLGGSGAQSARVLDANERFWGHESAPRGMLASPPATHHTLFKPLEGRSQGARMNALMASQKSVRGPHPQRLRMDEIDEMELSLLDAAMGQPMPLHGISSQTVLSSTHQYAFGTMTEILKRAAERGWPVYEWCYRETVEPHGWLHPSVIAEMKGRLTEAMFNAEVELQEPAPHSRAIAPEKVAQMFQREMGEYDGADGEYIEAEPPRAGASYATGADWAKAQDWTVVVTLRVDRNPSRVVAFTRAGRLPWPNLVGVLERHMRRFGGAAAHDHTGLGGVVGDILRERGLGENLEDVDLVGRARADLLSDYIGAIEREEIVAPFIRYMETEHRLASREDIYVTGQKHHLPDSICAGALALKAAGLDFNPAVW